MEPVVKYYTVQMINYPFLNEIRISRGENPLYLQISRSLASLIKQGVLKPGQKLPGSRTMAEILKVNRNTVCLATDELITEGWVISKPKSGLFVNDQLPLVQYAVLKTDRNRHEQLSGLQLTPNTFLQAPEVNELAYEFNDGVPDPRLSPLNELGREYHRLLKKSGPLKLFSYADAEGEPLLRKLLSKDLNENRGLHTTQDDIFISRGSIMALSLIAQATLQKNDVVVVGDLNYRTANLIFEQEGARLIRIPVDERGINTTALEELLQKERIRMLYVTSHHQHPTTVTLAPERRIHLYELSLKWGFFIIEDDYDFDYHYENRPTLPIASMDTSGLVVYIGSWSKTIYPGIRTGFIVAPKVLISEMVKYRRIIDRQGDHVMERAIANLMQDGTLQRYLRKSRKSYKKRKEYFCQILRTDFSSYLDFHEPEGGMAVWAKFRKNILLPVLSRLCKERNLHISDGQVYNPPGKNVNACRLGFAHMNEEEIKIACDIFKEALDSYL